MALVAVAVVAAEARAQLVGAVDSGYLSGRIETILGRETILRSTGNYEFSPSSSALRFPAGFDVVPGAIGTPFQTRTVPIQRPGVANASGSGVNVSRGGDNIVGYMDNGLFTPYHAFLSTAADGFLDLGAFALPNGQPNSSFAQDVSDDGSIVVGYSFTSEGSHPFRWTETSGMVDMGTAAGNGANFTARAFGMSADGGVIVGESQFPPPDEFGFPTASAFRWTASGGFASLGPDTVVANAVTADGSVVVGQGRVQAFRWTQSGGAESLGLLPGHTHSAAVAVSDDGEIVVGFSGTSQFGLAGFSERRGVGGAIEIIDATATRAFYWTEQAGMQDLTQLLLDAGADLGGNVINAALGISPDGEWIHGITTVPDEEFPELFYDEIPLMMSLSYSPPGNLPGDYNGSGQVEQGDLDLVLLNWGRRFDSLPASWLSQRPVSGIVDQAELDNVLLGWGATAAAVAAPAVPEPLTCRLLVVAACCALVRQQSRGKPGRRS